MKGKLIWSIFWSLVAIFILVVGIIFVPMLNQQSARVAPFGLIFLGAVFFLLGVALIVLTLKTKVAGTLKKFLLLSGAAPVGLPVFAVLHNLVSGLFDTEEPVFFILATLVCPLAFLVGAVGTIVLAIKNKSQIVPTGAP